MKIRCLMAGWLAISLLNPTTAFSLTLNEALEAAYGFNPDLKAQRKNLETTNEVESQSFSGWLPNASFALSRGKEIRKIGTDTGDDIARSHSFTLRQPIYRGGETMAQIKRAKLLVKADRHTLKLAEQDILLSTVQAYIDVVRDQEVLELSVNNEAVLKKHLMATGERFELGEVTKTDVAQAEARLAVAKSERLTAEGNLAVSRATFKRVSGEDAKNVSMPVLSDALPQDPEVIYNTAKDNNPQLLSIHYNQRASEKAVRIFKARILPQLNLDGAASYEEGTSRSGSNRFESESLTLNLSVPLYQSGAEYSRVRSAKYSAEQAKFDYQQTRNEVRESVVSSWQDLQVARSTIVSRKAAAVAAEIALEGVELEAEVGSRTILDVLDAEQELFSAQVEVVRAKHSEVQAYYELTAVMGKLSAKELGLNVDLYDPDAHYRKVRHKLIGF